MFRRKTKSLPDWPVEYPAGTFVSTPRGYFYIVSPSKRYRILSERVLNSWSPQRVVETTEAAVSKYRITAKMKFRNGSLIHNIANGRIYLIESGERRHVTSPDVLERIGATGKDVVTVSVDELLLHEEGEEIK